MVNIGTVGGSGPTIGNNRVQTSIGVGDTYAITPSTILNVQAGFARWTQEGLTSRFDLSTLGWPTVKWNPGVRLSVRVSRSAPECGAPITKTG